MVYVSHDKTIGITITNPISSAVDMKALHNEETTTKKRPFRSWLSEYS